METALFWKTMLVVIYAKITVTSQFYSVNLRKLEIIFLLIWCKQKFGNFPACLIWAVETTETVLRYFHWIIFYIWTYLKNAKYHIRWKLLHAAIYFFHDCHLQWNNHSKKFILNSWTLSNFPALEIKKLVFVGEMLWRFDIVLHIWLIYLFC